MKWYPYMYRGEANYHVSNLLPRSQLEDNTPTRNFTLLTNLLKSSQLYTWKLIVTCVHMELMQLKSLYHVTFESSSNRKSLARAVYLPWIRWKCSKYKGQWNLYRTDAVLTLIMGVNDMAIRTNSDNPVALISGKRNSLFTNTTSRHPYHERRQLYLYLKMRLKQEKLLCILILIWQIKSLSERSNFQSCHACAMISL